MDSLVTYRVLGPLEICVAGQPVSIAAAKVRAVLAALLLHANDTVQVSELIDYLWDGREPVNGRSTVQKYVMRARRVLDEAGAGNTAIQTDGEGYRLVTVPGQLDLEQFRLMTADAAEAAQAGDLAQEAHHLAGALELWRSTPPLSNVSVAQTWREVPELTERHLRILDRRLELDLERGRHAELIAELSTLVRRYPHQEKFWAHLMRSLHRAGRQGEALAAYRQITRRLADELGVDPGTELQRAHREILAAERSTDVVRSAQAAAGAAARQPVRQLPRSAVGFVGRRVEVTEIVSALDEAPVVISGMPGVGKSALAVVAAQSAAQRYPDGQLYADLGDFSGSPADLGSVLIRFLHAVGVPVDAVPDGVEEQAELYRSVLAERRMLVVLDDVADPSRVRMLLPGSPRCGVLVTSRDELAGLSVAPGAHRVRLGSLERPYAHRMLTTLVGTARVDAEPDEVDTLLEVCAGLPLAIRIVAAQLAFHTSASVAGHVARLCSGDPVANLCVAGDAQADLAVAFAGSVRRLRPEDRTLLWALGAAATSEITVQAAAAVTDVAPLKASAALERLAAESLLMRDPTGYAMHPLLRAYVCHRAPESADASEVRPLRPAERPMSRRERLGTRRPADGPAVRTLGGG